MVLSSCVTVDGWLTTFRISQKPIASFLRQLTKTKTNPKISFGFWFGSTVSDGLSGMIYFQIWQGPHFWREVAVIPLGIVTIQKMQHRIDAYITCICTVNTCQKSIIPYNSEAWPPPEVAAPPPHVHLFRGGTKHHPISF